MLAPQPLEHLEHSSQIPTKERCLKMLIAAHPQAISGQNLARKLNVNRNSVWKALQSLQRLGLRYTARTNKGYQLNDKRQAQALLASLRLKRLSRSLNLEAELARIFANQEFSCAFKRYKTISSTNTEAVRLALEGYPGHLLIYSEAQHCGRARNKQVFSSPYGHGVYTSLLINRSAHPQEVLRLANLACQCAATSANRLFSQLNKPSAPFALCTVHNASELYVGKAKIGGVLTEIHGTDMESCEFFVIGLGIYINLVLERMLRLEDLGLDTQLNPDVRDLFLLDFAHNLSELISSTCNQVQ